MKKLSKKKKADSDFFPVEPNSKSTTSCGNSLTHSVISAPMESTDKSIADITSFTRPPSHTATNSLPKPIPDWLARPHTSFSVNIPTGNLDSSYSVQISQTDWISEQLKAKLIEIGYSYLFPGNEILI